MKIRSEQGTRNRNERIFRKIWTIYIENVDQKINFLYGSDEIEIKLPFYRSECDWNVLLGLIMNKITRLNSLFVFFSNSSITLA